MNIAVVVDKLADFNDYCKIHKLKYRNNDIAENDNDTYYCINLAYYNYKYSIIGRSFEKIIDLTQLSAELLTRFHSMKDAELIINGVKFKPVFVEVKND